jgi:glycosyltransferase involved in cell wall biosynthesis
MKIAHTTSIYIPVPPPTHGGTEMIVHALCEGQTRLGHDVHLYASGDSSVSGTLHSVVDHATLNDPSVTTYMDKELETRSVFELYQRAADYDIVHCHWPTLAPYFAAHSATPTVITYHYVDRAEHEYYRANVPTLFPVCVSHKQAELLGEPDLPVVYNGLDMAATPFVEHSSDYLVIVGRIIPTKGIAEAIAIAREAGMRLHIVGDVIDYIPWTRAYFEERVKPHIDGDHVTHTAEMPNAKVLDLVSNAKAFLFPLQGDEPFGLTVLEAMATGTPVITMPRGSMPELVADGTSGYIVESEQQAVAAIANVDSLDRHTVRSHVERRFTHERMLSAYEAIYNDTIRSQRP